VVALSIGEEVRARSIKSLEGITGVVTRIHPDEEYEVCFPIPGGDDVLMTREDLFTAKEYVGELLKEKLAKPIVKPYNFAPRRSKVKYGYVAGYGRSTPKKSKTTGSKWWM